MKYFSCYAYICLFFSPTCGMSLIHITHIIVTVLPVMRLNINSSPQRGFENNKLQHKSSLHI